MTPQMQRLMNRVDGQITTVRPQTILPTLDQVAATPSTPGAAARQVAIADEGAAPRAAGILLGRVPRAIERLALLEPGEMHLELQAAGLL
jgi:hypothetical protein